MCEDNCGIKQWNRYDEMYFKVMKINKKINKKIFFDEYGRLSLIISSFDFVIIKVSLFLELN